MSLLTTDQIAQLASNGLSPDFDHKPVVLLKEVTDLKVHQLMQFLLNHMLIPNTQTKPLVWSILGMASRAG